MLLMVMNLMASYIFNLVNKKWPPNNKCTLTLSNFDFKVLNLTLNLNFNLFGLKC